MFLNTVLLIAMSLAWASNYVFILWTDHGLPPTTAGAAITGAAAIVLVIGVRLVLRRRLMPTLRQRPQAALIMAVTAIALPQLSVIAAEDTIQPDLSSVIGTTVPILTFIVSAFVLRTISVRPLNLIGIAVAVFGIILFSNPQALLSHPAELKGIAVMMAGGAVFVANGIYAARYATGLDQEVLTVWVMVFAAIGLSLAAVTIDGIPTSLPAPGSLIGIALSGTVGMALAYLIYYRLIARAGAPLASLYAFLVPPFGVFVASLSGSGTLNERHLIGVAFVVAGLVMILRPGRVSANPKF